MVIELKVGQIILMRGDKIINRAIQMGMGNYWSHAGWIVGSDQKHIYIQEAKGTKTKVVTNKYLKKDIYDRYNNNILGVFDFKIRPNSQFYNLVRDSEDKKYDYLSIILHFFRRIKRLFKKKNNKLIYETENIVSCSELIARNLSKLKSFEILTILNKKSFEQIKPQDLANLHDKLQNSNLL